jgi:hypothetical protein
MKKIIITAGIVCLASVYLFACDSRQSNQAALPADPGVKSGLPLLITLYYNIKDALVSDNAETAAKKAAEFVKAVNAMDMKKMSKADHNVFMPLQPKLLFDATHISETKDIEHQREHFENFSLNMFALAKGTKLSSLAIYEQYCPMKKAYWLSNNPAVKNPYYGSSMLTCGKTVETIK